MYVMTQSGWLEVICGSMFSGKSEELIRRIRRAQFAKQEVKVFKPTIDNRYSEDAVVSHNGNSVIAIPVATPAELFRYISATTDVVAIDEVQFFLMTLLMSCKRSRIVAIASSPPGWIKTSAANRSGRYRRSWPSPNR